MPDYLSGLKLAVSPAGPVQTSSFICIDGTQGSYQCRQATAAGDLAIGISQVGQSSTPNLVQTLAPGVTYVPPAGNPGDEIQIFSIGDTAPLRLGVGGCTAGAPITNDTAGNGIMVAYGSGVKYWALALQSGVQGDIIDVHIRSGGYP
jgi:hypothetical protein